MVLIVGAPAAGKSVCLRNLRDMDSYVYINAENKRLPFKDGFLDSVAVEDAKDVLDFIDTVEETPECKGAVLDSISFLMAMYERQYVIGSANTMKAWGDYGTFYNTLMHKMKTGTKRYIVTGHEDKFLNDETGSFEARVPVKGAVGKVGIVADFTIVVSVAKISTGKLKGFENSYLTITDKEASRKQKHVFITETYKGEGLLTRSPWEFWEEGEVFLDNDINHVLDKIKGYDDD